MGRDQCIHQRSHKEEIHTSPFQRNAYGSWLYPIGGDKELTRKVRQGPYSPLYGRHLVCTVKCLRVPLTTLPNTDTLRAS